MRKHLYKTFHKAISWSYYWFKYESGSKTNGIFQVNYNKRMENIKRITIYNLKSKKMQVPWLLMGLII